MELTDQSSELNPDISQPPAKPPENGAADHYQGFRGKGMEYFGCGVPEWAEPLRFSPTKVSEKLNFPPKEYCGGPSQAA